MSERPSAEKDVPRKSWLRAWGEEHSEGGVELASRQFGDYAPPARIWELSIWLDWTRFGLGFDAEREYGAGAMWPDRLHLAFTLGPLTFSAVRTWNERPLTRLIPPGEPR